MTQANQAVSPSGRQSLTFIETPEFRKAVAEVLPKHLTAERIVRVAITAVMGKPQILSIVQTPVGKASLLNALLRCSQAGLELDGRLAHLVPFGDTLQLIFDYKGLLTLAKRNGVDAKAVVVRENDDFDYTEDDGTGKTLVQHRFDPFAERGAVIGVYSRAVSDGKAADYEFMSKADVDAIRKRSRASGNGPWVTDYDEMAKKTVLRRHSKRWDLDPDIRASVYNDDDTPDFEPKPLEVNRPLFGKPVEALPEGNGEKPVDADPTGLRNQTPPQPAEPEPKKLTPKQAALKAVEQALMAAGIMPGVLLDYLATTGSSDGSESQLSELTANVLQGVMDNWATLRQQLLAAQPKPTPIQPEAQLI